LEKGRTLSVRLMDELARCVPDHLWLNGATQETSGSISLEGVTFSNLVVSDFMSRLERSAMFSDVELEVAERTELSDHNVVKFHISCKVTPAELLRADRQLPVLLRRITLAAQQTGVEFVVFRPNEVKTEEHYVEMPMQLSVYGGYHQIGSFIAELANMRRIVTVSGLQLKTSKADEEGT